MITQADVIRFFADGALLLIIAVGAYMLGRLVLRRSGYREIPVMVMAGMTALLVGKLASLAYQPSMARPFVELGLTPGAAFIDNPGFPSDPALLGGVIVLAVAVLVRNRAVTVVLACLLLGMCVARVLALVHTPLDVVGGLSASAIGGLWYMYSRRFYDA